LYIKKKIPPLSNVFIVANPPPRRNFDDGR